MPTIFRPPRPDRRFAGKRKLYIHGSSILTAVGAAAGVAAVTGVAVAIIATTGSTAGSASVNGVGAGVKTGVGSAAGVATVSGIGSGYFVTVGVAAGAATVDGQAEHNQITSTLILKKPVDYALAGEQHSFKSGRARGRALAHAFDD